MKRLDTKDLQIEKQTAIEKLADGREQEISYYVVKTAFSTTYEGSAKKTYAEISFRDIDIADLLALATSSLIISFQAALRNENETNKEKKDALRALTQATTSDRPMVRSWYEMKYPLGVQPTSATQKVRLSPTMRKACKAIYTFTPELLKAPTPLVVIAAAVKSLTSIKGNVEDVTAEMVNILLNGTTYGDEKLEYQPAPELGEKVELAALAALPVSAIEQVGTLENMRNIIKASASGAEREKADEVSAREQEEME